MAKTPGSSVGEEGPSREHGAGVPRYGAPGSVPVRDAGPWVASTPSAPLLWLLLVATLPTVRRSANSGLSTNTLRSPNVTNTLADSNSFREKNKLLPPKCRAVTSPQLESMQLFVRVFQSLLQTPAASLLSPVPATPLVPLLPPGHSPSLVPRCLGLFPSQRY